MKCVARVEHYGLGPDSWRDGLVPTNATAELIRIVLRDRVAGAARLQLDDCVLVVSQCPSIVRADLERLVRPVASEAKVATQKFPGLFSLICPVRVPPDDSLEDVAHAQHQLNTVRVGFSQVLGGRTGLHGCSLDCPRCHVVNRTLDHGVFDYSSGEGLLSSHRVDVVEVCRFLFHQVTTKGLVLQTVDSGLQAAHSRLVLPNSSQVECQADGSGLGANRAGLVVLNICQGPSACCQPLRFPLKTGVNGFPDLA